MFKLLKLPFQLAFGLIRLGFELFFGLFQGIFGLVFGILGLVFGLIKGLFGLIFVGAVIAFVAAMFNRGFKSGARPRRSSAQMVEEFQTFFHQNAR